MRGDAAFQNRLSNEEPLRGAHIIPDLADNVLCASSVDGLDVPFHIAFLHLETLVRIMLISGLPLRQSPFELIDFHQGMVGRVHPLLPTGATILLPEGSTRSKGKGREGNPDTKKQTNSNPPPVSVNNDESAEEQDVIICEKYDKCDHLKPNCLSNKKSSKSKQSMAAMTAEPNEDSRSEAPATSAVTTHTFRERDVCIVDSGASQHTTFS